jgi:hypothetical protein
MRFTSECPEKYALLNLRRMESDWQYFMPLAVRQFCILVPPCPQNVINTETRG